MPMRPNEAEMLVVDEIREVVARTQESEIVATVDAILGADRVFVAGSGRSLLVMRAFAMRLMHIGLSSHVVGETITPSIEPGDLLMVGTGSGQTRTTLAMVEAAASRGARTLAMTAHVDAPIPQAADMVFEIHSPFTGERASPGSQQPAGSLFEQALLVHCEGMVLRLMARLGTNEEEMRARHTKLE